VPELEREIRTIRQNQAAYKQQEFAMLPSNIQDTAIQYGKQLVEQSRQQAEQARLAQLQARKAEKQRIQSLHKTKNWSELTPDERKEVRRLLVNAPEFENRQDYLDFKRAFGAYVERASCGKSARLVLWGSDGSNAVPLPGEIIGVYRLEVRPHHALW